MTDLSGLTNEQLADAFAELSRKQGTALEREDTARYNDLFDEVEAVNKELRARGTEARKVLIPLLAVSTKEPLWSYQAAQTRFNAAVQLKAVVPELARATLLDMSSHGPRTYQGMAGMSLSYDEQGISKPV